MHAKVNTYHVSLFSQFIERLKVTEDGDGSLLDHSLILYGSGMGNGSVHSADLLPTLLVGSGGGTVKAIATSWLEPSRPTLISSSALPKRKASSSRSSRVATRANLSLAG